MDVTPVFAFFGSEDGNWQVQGISSDGTAQHFTFGPVSLVQNAGSLSAFVSCNQSLPNTIDSQSLTIIWNISMDGGKTWTAPCGVSKNHLFVTGGSAPTAFETVLWLGTNGAPTGKRPHDVHELNPGGINADRSVVDAIWSKFTGLSVKRVDGVLMNYNHDEDEPDPTDDSGHWAPDMLAQKDGKGQCTAWADLFAYTLTTEGVACTETRIDPPANANKFAVKPMRAQGSGSANYPIGTKASGGFIYHEVIEIECYPNSIYDPSYGGKLTTGASMLAAQLRYEDLFITDIFVRPKWVQVVPPTMAGSLLQLIFTP